MRWVHPLPRQAVAVTKLRAAAARLGTLAPKLAAPAKRAEGFYTSPEWRALVASRKRDRDHAEAKARARPGERLILDHKHERKDGGADLDPANTEWLTMSEHQAKTARARAARAQGRPLNPTARPV
jgi:5-methylcytosine-specific restriction protein A